MWKGVTCYKIANNCLRYYLITSLRTDDKPKILNRIISLLGFDIHEPRPCHVVTISYFIQ